MLCQKTEKKILSN